MDANLNGTSDNQLVITVRGEIDLPNANALLRRLIDLAHPATGRTALDLSQVGFMDCAGPHMLIAIDRHIRDRGGSMHVADASPAVDRLFELIDALTALPAYLLPDNPHSAARDSAPRTRTSLNALGLRRSFCSRASTGPHGANGGRATKPRIRMSALRGAAHPSPPRRRCCVPRKPAGWWPYG